MRGGLWGRHYDGGCKECGGEGEVSGWRFKVEMEMELSRLQITFLEYGESLSLRHEGT